MKAQSLLEVIGHDLLACCLQTLGCCRARVQGGLSVSRQRSRIGRTALPRMENSRSERLTSPFENLLLLAPKTLRFKGLKATVDNIKRRIFFAGRAKHWEAQV